MSEQPTLRQRVVVALQDLAEIRQRISTKAEEINVLEIEHQQRRENLKALIVELSPALAHELFDSGNF